ncbi:MAG: Cof-type HAD-IIB family hydrolase [Pantoea sp.]|nr:Cof-type HAD-IIB family hydrolase [Pantoea sp.]
MADIKLVAVDMDGTFLDDGKNYNRARFAEQYAELKARGIRFVVASGNQYYQLRSFFPDIAHEIAFVAENGAYIVEAGEDRFVGEFPHGDVTKIIDTLARGNYPELNYVLCGYHSAWYFTSTPAAYIEKMRRYCHRLQPTERLDDINDRLFKFALNLSDEYVPVLMADIERHHAGVATAVTSGHGSVDLIIPGLHKAHGLALLQQRWGIAHEQVVAFGDGGNDLEMLSQAGFGFAMANAPDRVKAAAEYQAPSNNHEGVLEVIQQLLEGRHPFA